MLQGTVALGVEQLQAAEANFAGQEQLLQVEREVVAAILAGERGAWQTFLESDSKFISRAAEVAVQQLTAAAPPPSSPWGSVLLRLTYLALAEVLCCRVVVWGTMVVPRLAAKDRQHHRAPHYPATQHCRQCQVREPEQH